MTNARYQDVARLLGGKYRAGMAGTRRTRAYGEIGPVTFEFNYLRGWEETKRPLRSTQTTRSFRHEFRLDYPWSDQPMLVAQAAGDVVCKPAVASELPEVSIDQMVLLHEAFTSWRGLAVTNHGFEWVIADTDQTAQDLAVIVQGQARLLAKLRPATDRKPSATERLRSRLPTADTFDQLRERTGDLGRRLTSRGDDPPTD